MKRLEVSGVVRPIYGPLGVKRIMIQSIQSDSGGKGTVSVTARKNVHVNMCLILNGYQGRAVSIFRPNYVRFLFVVLDEGRSLQSKGGYTRRIVHSNFGCCCLHQER